MLIELAVFIGYVLLIAYYRYVSISIIDAENAKGAPDAIKNVFLTFTSAIFILFWIYTIIKHRANSVDNPLLGKSHLYFILAMSVYLSMSLGLVTNIGFKWFMGIAFVIIGLVVLPFLYRGVVDNGVNRLFPGAQSVTASGAEPTGNAFSAVIYPFYTSYVFLFGAIIVSLLIVLSLAPKFNIPNMDTWQQWTSIATVIFGLKHFLFYRFSSSSMYLTFGFLAAVTALTFFMIQPTATTQTTLTVLFSIACVLFAILIPTDIPYLTLGFFTTALVAAICFGLFTQRLNFSIVQLLFGIFSVYLVIHFANSLQPGQTKKVGEALSKTPNFSIAVGLYLIAWALITTLYSTNLDATNQPQNVSTISISTAMMIITIGIFGAMSYFSKSSTTVINDGMWIGAITTLVGVLLMMYYLISSAYGAHLNYAIVALVILFMVGTLGFMAYNLKNIVNLLMFFLVLFLPILFIYLLKKSTSGMSSTGGTGTLVNIKSPGMLIGGCFLLLLWMGISIAFWSSSSLTFETLLNVDFLNIALSFLLLYISCYYIYQTVTSKVSIAQRFSQIALIVMCGYLFLQIFKKSKMSKNPFVAFIINVIEYIPCLYDGLVTRALNAKPDETMKEDFTYNSMGAKILAAVVVMIIGYYLYPSIKKWTVVAATTPGVTLIGDTPFPVNETRLIKTYEELTGTTEKPLYNYGVSFSLFINPTSGNDAFHPLVNFCGNLVAAYNTAKNQLLIYTLREGDGEDPPQVALYRYNLFPLQKWVKVEVNYVGGVFDVFVDNMLKSSNKVVAYNSHENVVVGETGSLVLGKVKDFMYYEKPLSISQIQNVK